MFGIERLNFLYPIVHAMSLGIATTLEVSVSKILSRLLIPLTITSCIGLPMVAGASEPQLAETSLNGAPEAVEAARQAADGVLRVVNGFEAADKSGDLSALTAVAQSVYAPDAEVFRSQDFIAAEDSGGPAFLKALAFLNDVLGNGTEYLAPVQVCGIYAYKPEGSDDLVDFIMTTEAMVPKFGQVVNTVLVKTRAPDGVRQITYHDYIAAPAGGEDCNGPTAAAVAAEWTPKVQ
jgi:hypothetical protein